MPAPNYATRRLFIQAFLPASGGCVNVQAHVQARAPPPLSTGAAVHSTTAIERLLLLLLCITQHCLTGFFIHRCRLKKLLKQSQPFGSSRGGAPAYMPPARPPSGATPGSTLRPPRLHTACRLAPPGVKYNCSSRCICNNEAAFLAGGTRQEERLRKQDWKTVPKPVCRFLAYGLALRGRGVK